MTFAEDYPFTDLLKKAGVNKAQLARRLGITPNAISAWKETPPKYAGAFLEVLIAFNELKVDFIHLKNPQ